MEASDWIALGSGVVAVAAAIIAGWQAHIARTAADKQMKLSERIHREQNEPYVVVDLGADKAGSSLLVMSIENIGSTVARDVVIRFDPPLESSDAKFTERLQRALSRPIPMLPPGRRMLWAFDTFRRWKAELPMEYTVTVESNGPAGPVESLTYRISLEALAESLVGERPTKHVEESLGVIASSVNSLTDQFQKANGTAIRAEEQWRIERLRRMADESDS